MPTSARQKNIAKIKADLEKLVKDGEKLLKDESNNVKSNGQDLHQQLMDTLASAKEFCGEMEGKAREKVETIDESVHERPYAYLGMACGLGVMVGLLLGKRS